MQSPLLSEINVFLAETGMGPSYFGEKACGNSKLIGRLKEGRPIQSDTEAKVRSFIIVQRHIREQAGASA